MRPSCADKIDKVSSDVCTDTYGKCQVVIGRLVLLLSSQSEITTMRLDLKIDRSALLRRREERKRKRDEDERRAEVEKKARLEASERPEQAAKDSEDAAGAQEDAEAAAPEADAVAEKAEEAPEKSAEQVCSARHVLVSQSGRLREGQKAWIVLCGESHSNCLSKPSKGVDCATACSLNPVHSNTRVQADNVEEGGGEDPEAALLLPRLISKTKQEQPAAAAEQPTLDDPKDETMSDAPEDKVMDDLAKKCSAVCQNSEEGLADNPSRPALTEGVSV